MMSDAYGARATQVRLAPSATTRGGVAVQAGGRSVTSSQRLTSDKRQPSILHTSARYDSTAP